MRKILKGENVGLGRGKSVIDLKHIANSRNYFVEVHEFICKHCHPGGRCWLSVDSRGD